MCWLISRPTDWECPKTGILPEKGAGAAGSALPGRPNPTRGARLLSFLKTLVLTALAFAAPVTAYADGAVAVVEDGRGNVFVQFSIDDATEVEARNEALQYCTSRKNTPNPCSVIATFKDTCAGFARFYSGQYFVRTGPDVQSANAAAYLACIRSYPNKNAEQLCGQYNQSFCDQTPVSYQSSAQQTNGPFALVPQFSASDPFRYVTPTVFWSAIGVIVLAIVAMGSISKLPSIQPNPHPQNAAQPSSSTAHGFSPQPPSLTARADSPAPEHTYRNLSSAARNSYRRRYFPQQP